MSSALCFKEGTNILCVVDGNEVYLPIEKIRHGNLVKTLKSGVKRVELIGNTIITNGGNIKTDNLYLYTKASSPELTEDLIVTGGHSALVDELSTEQRDQTIALLGDVSVTEGKFQLMAFLDPRAEPYTVPGTFTVWHLVLENFYKLKNYGIYANGLLVETASKRSMTEDTRMNLLPYSGPPIVSSFAPPVNTKRADFKGKDPFQPR